MRRWQAMASSQPPPSAKPLTAASTGFVERSSESRLSCRNREKSCASAGLSSDISAMSAPATNALSPAPVRTSTRTSGSPIARAAAAAISSTVARLRAFSFSGRFTVIQPTPSSTS